MGLYSTHKYVITYTGQGIAFAKQFHRYNRQINEYNYDETAYERLIRITSRRPMIGLIV